AYIPSSYIPAQVQRLDMYKRICVISSLQDKYDVEEELEDRYSTMPQAVTNLISVAYMRSMGKKCSITEIKQEKSIFTVIFAKTSALEKINRVALPKAIKISVDVRNNLQLKLDMSKLPQSKHIQTLVLCIEAIEKAFSDKENTDEK
ncbi:MAG: hypothetical protein E7315_04365, partial [Clostridiales bacterium]|nr:hypothetical protein [Clostridiales bacterium]